MLLSSYMGLYIVTEVFIIVTLLKFSNYLVSFHRRLIVSLKYDRIKLCCQYKSIASNYTFKPFGQGHSFVRFIVHVPTLQQVSHKGDSYKRNFIK